MLKPWEWIRPFDWLVLGQVTYSAVTLASWRDGLGGVGVGLLALSFVGVFVAIKARQASRGRALEFPLEKALVTTHLACVVLSLFLAGIALLMSAAYVAKCRAHNDHSSDGSSVDESNAFAVQVLHIDYSCRDFEGGFEFFEVIWACIGIGWMIASLIYNIFYLRQVQVDIDSGATRAHPFQLSSSRAKVVIREKSHALLLVAVAHTFFGVLCSLDWQSGYAPAGFTLVLFGLIGIYACRVSTTGDIAESRGHINVYFVCCVATLFVVLVMSPTTLMRWRVCQDFAEAKLKSDIPPGAAGSSTSVGGHSFDNSLPSSGSNLRHRPVPRAGGSGTEVPKVEHNGYASVLGRPLDCRHSTRVLDALSAISAFVLVFVMILCFVAANALLVKLVLAHDHPNDFEMFRSSAAAPERRRALQDPLDFDDEDEVSEIVEHDEWD